MKRATYKPKYITTFFDSAGGITIFTARYAHHYSSAEQAARDFCALASGHARIKDWDGNEIATTKLDWRWNLYSRDKIIERAYNQKELEEIGLSEGEFYEHIIKYGDQIKCES